ncbi:MAG: serine/threonine-protein kinase [Nannocystaceae bacterium]
MRWRVADPRVLAILDVGSWRGRVFVTTELLDGETLQTWRARTRPAWTEVVARYREAGRGLAAAHAAGVIHRDFKPANVMQTRDGRVVVLDFGLAQLDDEHGSGPSDGGDDGEPSTITARVVGTPAFMAPEQRDGRACGPEADQFAFCVALWAALFGRFPAAATYPAANVGHGPARGRVPLALRRALERGLAGAPDDRHRTRAALRQAIERARRSVRRRRLLAALALPVLALAAMRPGTDDQRCSGAAQALARSYDPARARAAAEAIAGSGHAWSEDAAAGVRRALDGYAASWLVAHEQACEAAAARAFAGDPLLDAQMACLDRRRLALATVLDGLVEGGHDPSRTALAAVEGLPPVASCNGDDALAEAARLPDDPVARRAAAMLREQADRIGALRRLARFDDALALAQSARDDAARLGDLATQAEVGLAAAGLFDDLGRWSDVEDALTTALQAAESAGYDSAAATAAMRLGDLLGERLGRVDEARALLDQAQRWMERAGEPSGLAVELARTRGYVELAAGAPTQARARFEQALVAAAGSSGAVDPDELALVHNGLGNATLALGELDAAHHALELALASLRARLGPHHPNVVRAQVNLASVRRMRGDASGARALLLDSLATVQDAGTRAQPVVSETLLNLAVAGSTWASCPRRCSTCRTPRPAW